MKKLIICITSMLLLCATLSAQNIQRSFLGLTFGVSTRNDIEKMLQDKGLEFTKDGDDYNADNINFSGHKWRRVCFLTYNNRLFQVIFMENELSTSKENIRRLWDNYSTSIDSKYSQYYKSELSTPEDSYYSDNITMIRLNGQKSNGYETIGLVYTDLDLYYKKTKDEENEL